MRRTLVAGIDEQTIVDFDESFFERPGRPRRGLSFAYATYGPIGWRRFWFEGLGHLRERGACGRLLLLGG